MKCGLQLPEVFSSGRASPFVFNGITFREWNVIGGHHLARDAARKRRLFFRLMAEASDVMRRQGSGVRTTSGLAGHNLSKKARLGRTAPTKPLPFAEVPATRVVPANPLRKRKGSASHENDCVVCRKDLVGGQQDELLDLRLRDLVALASTLLHDMQYYITVRE